jgi:hypothetical protein
LADVPRALRILALIHRKRNDRERSEIAIREAERALHAAGMVPDSGRTIITKGQIALSYLDSKVAMDAATEALALAQPRQMRLVHADALVLRGRSLLAEFAEKNGVQNSDQQMAALFRAIDDGEDALSLAREAGYIWAERDALFLLADAYSTQALAFDRPDQKHRADEARRTAAQYSEKAEIQTAKLQFPKQNIPIKTEADPGKGV